jgi:DNA-directed RNA polymerase subunit RPC12/RpoP
VHLVCQFCGAGLELPEGRRTTVCPYCDSPSVIERPPAPDRPTPAFAIGFSVQREKAADAMRRWARMQAFKLKRSGLEKAPVEEIQGIYAPAYLYGAKAVARYTATIGEDYWETETYTTTENGRTVTKTRRVRKTEWRPLSGVYASYVSDVIVTASKGLPNDEMQAVEPFHLRDLHRYGPELVAGWVAEDPSLTVAQCFELARAEARQLLSRALSSFMPGDRHRDLRFEPRFESEALDLVLVPLWVFAVRYDAAKPPMRVVVNGQTGRAFGRAPWSSVKIAIVSILAAAALAALAVTLGRA